MYNNILDVKGLKVGQVEDRNGLTGCTVVICEEGAVCGVDVRGGGPGTRETDLLNPINMIQKVHAVVLSGGSAFGLESTCGVSKYLEENKWKLYENNMRIGTVSLNDKSEVEQLIVDYMGKYNKLSIEDEDWQEQIRNNNVVGIYVADNLIAVYYFTEKASRIVVGKNYRGQNLSVYLRMYFASQIRWAISSKNQYDWAEANNISTKITFAKLFAIYTGKIKYRYVKTI